MVWGIILTAVLGAIIYWFNEKYEAPIKKQNPSFDRAEGSKPARDGVDLLWRQDWSGLSALYRAQPPSDRYHFIQGLGRLAVVDTPLPGEQADSAALTIAGGLRVVQAWRFRGGGRATDVSDNDARQMIDCLLSAQELLNRALTINPADTTALAWLIRAEMGLSGDKQKLANILAAYEASFERNLFVAANHIQFLAPKWHGSVDEMWAAANRWATSAPNGAWLAIAARAHVEEWLFATMFGDPAANAVYSARLTDPAFLELVRHIDSEFWKRAETELMTSAEALFAHNALAFLLNLVRANDLLRAHLERIGPSISQQPWEYLPSGAEHPTELLNRLRVQTGLPRLAR